MKIEVESKDLTSSMFAHYIDSFGSILVRSLFNQRQIQRTLQAVIEHFQVAHESCDEELYFMEKYRGAAFISRIEKMEKISPSIVDLFSESPLPDILRDYFNDEVGIVNRQSRFRRMKADSSQHALPAHQDFVVFNSLAAFTVWIPLVDSGEHNPGLSVFSENVRAVIDHSLDKTCGRYAELELEDYYRDPQKWLEPIVRSGDVIIFPPTTIHRTFLPKKVTKDRYSSELRIVPKSCFAMPRYKGDIVEI